MKSIALAFLVFVVSASVLAETPPKAPFDLFKSDADVIRHIQHTDPVFTSVLGHCSNDKLVRSHKGKDRLFVYTAICAIKPLSDSECPAYLVRAAGTIDHPQWATVRTMSLALQCPEHEG